MPPASPDWASLASAARAIAPMRELFANDSGRLGKHVVEAAGIVLDASKNRVDDQLLAALFALARAANVEARRAAMFAGERINVTENRAVLHVALRAPRDASIAVDGADVMPDVHAVLDHMATFSDDVRE